MQNKALAVTVFVPCALFAIGYMAASSGNPQRSVSSPQPQVAGPSREPAAPTSLPSLRQKAAAPPATDATEPSSARPRPVHGEELDQAAVDYTLVWPGEPLQAPDGWAPDSAAEAIWRQQGAVEGGILVNVYCDEYPCIGVLSAESSDMDHTAIATSLGCDFFGYSGGNVYSLCGEGELPADSIDRLQARLMAAVAWQADD